MKASRYFLAWSLIFSLICFQCSILDQLAQVEKPTARINNIHVTGLDFNEINLNIDVAINNPNAFGIRLAQYDYSLSANKNEILKGTQLSGIHIKAGDRSHMTIPLAIEFQKMYGFIVNYRNQDSTRLDLSAGLGFELPVLGTLRVPLQHHFHIPNMQLPKISVKHLKVNSLTFSGASLDLVLNVENKNPVDLLMNNFNFKLDINNTSWAEGELSSVSKVGQKGTFEYFIPVKLDFIKMGSTVFQLLSQKNPSLDYNLNADVLFGSSYEMFHEMKLPIQSHGKINLVK